MTSDFILTPRILGWIILSLVLVTLPHVLRLPPWVPVFFAAALAWRYYLGVRGLRVPPVWVRTLLGVAVMAGVLLQFRTVFGRDPGIAFLVALSAIKFLETADERDAMLTVFLGYFLIITNFFYSQSIFTALYLFLTMLVMTATLVTFSDRTAQMPVQGRLRLAGTLLVQAIPLMIVVFVLFPRVEGPFWKLPRDASSALTGLSDEMSPGSISQLSNSTAVAFRVKVESGAMPPPEARYWRGPVLWWFNGRTWKQGYNQHEDPVPVDFEGKPVTYWVTLEPHNQSWLYALDLPRAAPPGLAARLTADYRIHSKYPLGTRVRYRVTSHPEYRFRKLTRTERHITLRLPHDRHPQARALAAQWKNELSAPADRVQRALAYFHRENFVYTLEPPLLLNDPIDEFLFDTRRGFCEHYASAFTVLMRAAGVPARVVTGYQGGELNPLGDYWIVRQRDAHAWSEVWLEDQGWVRIDPTAAVSPQRIERGISDALPGMIAPLGFEVGERSPLGRLWSQLDNSWDAVNNAWNEWVLGYGPEVQRQVLSSLGLHGGWRAMVTALFAIGAAFLLAVGLWLLRGRRFVPKDPVQRWYGRFCRHLARLGTPRHAYEGPLDFSRRAGREHPNLAQQIETISNLYMALRYRGETDKLPNFAAAIKIFLAR